MRIIFTGTIKHATQMLNDNYGIFLDLVNRNLPEINHSSFSGDVLLPENKFGSEFLQIGNYLYPTVEIHSNEKKININISYLKEGMDVMEILKKLFKQLPKGYPVEDIAKNDEETREFSFSSNCEFSLFTQFVHNDVKFFSGDDEFDADINLSIEETKAGDNILYTYRITENDINGNAYKFSNLLAKIISDSNILYYSNKEKKGWEFINTSWSRENGKFYIHSKTELVID